MRYGVLVVFALALVSALAAPTSAAALPLLYDFEWSSSTTIVDARAGGNPPKVTTGATRGEGTLTISNASVVFPGANFVAYDFTYSGQGGSGSGHVESPVGPGFVSFQSGLPATGLDPQFGPVMVLADGSMTVTGEPLRPSAFSMSFFNGARCCLLSWESSFTGTGSLRTIQTPEPLVSVIAVLGLLAAGIAARRRRRPQT